MSFYNLVVLVVSMEVFIGSSCELMNFSLPWLPVGGLITVFLMILICRLFNRNLVRE